MLTVLVCNKIKAPEIVQDGDIVVSIRTPGDEVNFFIKTPLKALYIAFHDVDTNTREFHGEILSESDMETVKKMVVCYDEDKADTVAEFLVACFKEKISRIVIHCDAGRSRSRGVAAALLNVLGMDDSHLYRDATPNAHVKKLTTQAFYRIATKLGMDPIQFREHLLKLYKDNSEGNQFKESDKPPFHDHFEMEGFLDVCEELHDKLNEEANKMDNAILSHGGVESERSMTIRSAAQHMRQLILIARGKNENDNTGQGNRNKS